MGISQIFLKNPAESLAFILQCDIVIYEIRNYNFTL